LRKAIGQFGAANAASKCNDFHMEIIIGKNMLVAAIANKNSQMV
jgi:hypothetical protein